MKRLSLGLVLAAATLGAVAAPAPAPSLWARENLIAWCIVPYDAKKRDPEARAVMLEQLQLRKFAYDWRAEHVPTFDAEVLAMAKHHVEIVAWWFPAKLDDNARKILDVIARHRIHPQLWVTGAGAAVTGEAEQQARIAAELTRLRPIVAETARLGCDVGLYNHGGWFGEPENQLVLREKLRAEGFTNVGLVYNFHHGHEHLARFPALWAKMKDAVYAVNINGMKTGGDKAGAKILTLGEGDREMELMRVIQASGWRGPVGILNHRTDVDAEAGLRGNLAGLERIAAALRSP